jgi:DNA-binding transcriptional MerR regulator
MRFETAQVLEIAGISKDTLRHWKKVLVPISRLDGRSVRYSLPELVAICVIARATQELGVTISQIAKSADWLFAEANDRLPTDHDGDIIYLLPDGTGVWSPSLLGDIDAAIKIRIGPILEKIRLAPQQATQAKAQLVLPFQATTDRPASRRTRK